MGNFSNSTTANGLYEFVKNPFWIIETICIGWFTIEVSKLRKNLKKIQVFGVFRIKAFNFVLNSISSYEEQ